MKQFLPLCICFLSIIVASAGETLKIGDPVPALKAKDQHGTEFELKKGVQKMFVSFDMSTGKEANAYFAGKGADLLKDGRAVYVSNIHGMPAIGRVFALPKMRKYPHRIILADSENLLARYPQQKDRITILALDSELKITQIAFWNPKDEPAPDGKSVPKN